MSKEYCTICGKRIHHNYHRSEIIHDKYDCYLHEHKKCTQKGHHHHCHCGAQGNAGNQGAQGNSGNQGAQGNDGNQGAQGNDGNQGAQGNDGNQGAQGNDGNQGAQGNDGNQGAQGNDGNQGAQGNAGNQGAQGNNGNQGAQGNAGNQGAQGNAGNQGAQGNNGNQGAQGNAGNQGAQGNNGNQGAQGNAGNQGAQGNNGNQGSQGNNGNQGAQGNAGNQGAQGNNGNQGAQGNAGNQGSQGNAGNQGAQGNNGNQGAQGSTGQGTQGNQGNQGTQGNQGNQGAQGNAGNQGAQGNSGGSQGAQGNAGNQGAQGNIGNQGAQGNIGNQGAAGSTGLQGAVGDQGPPGGAQGAQGPAGQNAAISSIFLWSNQSQPKTIANSCNIVGYINGTTLTVTQINSGVISIGTFLIGSNVTAGTQITAYQGTLSQVGGLGVYTVNLSQTVPTNTTMEGTLQMPIKFTGSISGTTLTITANTVGIPYVGMFVVGTSVTANTQIISQLSATTYTVNISQTVASTTMTGPLILLPSFTGSISSTTLTVTAITTGTVIMVGMYVSNASASFTAQITALGTGTGGTGTYTISPSQTVASTSMTVILPPTSFTGSISGTYPPTLTVTAIATGAISPGMLISGTGITVSTQITAMGTGVGGIGTYTVNQSTAVSSTTITGTTTQFQEISYEQIPLGPDGSNWTVVPSTNYARYTCTSSGWYLMTYKMDLRTVGVSSVTYTRAASAIMISSDGINWSVVPGSGSTAQAPDTNHQYSISNTVLVNYTAPYQLAVQWWAGYYSNSTTAFNTNVSGLSLGPNNASTPNNIGPTDTTEQPWIPGMFSPSGQSTLFNGTVDATSTFVITRIVQE